MRDGTLRREGHGGEYVAPTVARRHPTTMLYNAPRCHKAARVAWSADVYLAAFFRWRRHYSQNLQLRISVYICLLHQVRGKATDVSSPHIWLCPKV
jgi:hypothetical protein